MAEELGKKLMAEIEEVAFDEILQSLRLRTDTDKSHFGLPQLDALVESVTNARSYKPGPTQPVVEVTSPASGGGKTHLLYHLITLAVLPSHLRGRQGCAVVVDADGSFSVSRLAQQLRRHLITHQHTPDEQSETSMNDAVSGALQHVHLFRPQSLASLLDTLDNLPTYLFDSTQHHSFERAVSFVAIDSASAFYWQAKAEEENEVFLASVTKDSAQVRTTSPYQDLPASLRTISQIFACPIILTSRHLSPVPKPPSHTNLIRSLRPSLPAPLSNLPTLRLIVQRMPVRKFPMGISVEEARREAADRQQAVEEGRFECVVNEYNVDERTLQRLSKDGGGFNFRIKADGLLVEQAEKQ